jgi:hypothetical protein
MWSDKKMAEPLVKDVSLMQGQSHLPSSKPLEFVMNGKVLSSSRFEGSYRTLLSSPAPDEYSMPSVFEVQSEERLGNIDEKISILVVAKGIPHKFKSLQTGEWVKTARHFFNFIRFVH